MTSILKVSSLLWCAVMLLGLFPSGQLSAAEDTQTLSVSPTLFQMSATPSQNWQSEIRIINVNNYEITVYPQVVNFAPLGETGRGDLIPIFESETQGKTLAEWVTLSTEGVVIPPQKTINLPFKVTVPSDAAPGGHYAAIMVGTKPPVRTGGVSQVQTAQFVTSLLFVRVAGNVVEAGSIREFRTTQSIVQTPEATFELRFENDGNVHLQPQGDITVYNMWGSERGVIPINHQTHFGNVLPSSIRQFIFVWTGADSLTDIGRYRAVATLGYGDEQKKFVTSITYFWIIPYQQLITFILIVGTVGWFFTFAIRLYVRRMLVLAGVEPRAFRHHHSASNQSSPVPAARETVIIQRYQTVVAPVRFGVADLVARLKRTPKEGGRLFAVGQFIRVYRIFFIAIIVVITSVIMVVLYIRSVGVETRPYDVIITNPDTSVTLSSEQILYNELSPPPVVSEAIDQSEVVSVDVINASGVSGLGALTRQSLESEGFVVSSLENDLSRTDDRTVIIYHVDDQESALRLSQKLAGALLSASQEQPAGTLTVYVGTDMQAE